MVKHPVKEAGGQRSHVSAFEAIAVGHRTRCRPETLEWLINHDLITRRPDKILGHDRFGVMRVPQYEVPIWAHMAWCNWRSEQPGVVKEAKQEEVKSNEYI